MKVNLKAKRRRFAFKFAFNFFITKTSLPILIHSKGISIFQQKLEAKLAIISNKGLQPFVADNR